MPKKETQQPTEGEAKQSKERLSKSPESLKNKLEKIAGALDQVHHSLGAHKKKMKEHIKTIQDSLSGDVAADLVKAAETASERATELQKKAGELLALSNAAGLVEGMVKSGGIYENGASEVMAMLDATAGAGSATDLSAVKQKLMEHVAYKHWEDSGKTSAESANWQAAQKALTDLSWDEKVKLVEVAPDETPEIEGVGLEGVMQADTDEENWRPDMRSESERLAESEAELSAAQESAKQNKNETPAQKSNEIPAQTPDTKSEIPKRAAESKERNKENQTIDIPEKIFKELIGSGIIGKEIIQKLIYSEDAKSAAILFEKIFDNLPADIKKSLEKILQKQGFENLQDFIDNKWKTGLSETVADALRGRIQSDLRAKGVEDLSLLDKAKANWKTIAVAMVPALAVGVAGGAIGAAVLGTWGAIAAGISAAGIYSKAAKDSSSEKKGWFTRTKEKLFGDMAGKSKSATEEAIAHKIFDPRSKDFTGSIADNLAEDLQNDTTLALLLSQSVRENTSSQKGKVNHEMLMRQVSEQLRNNGETEQADAAQLEGLMAGLENGDSAQIKELLSEVKSNPWLAKALVKFQEAKGGKVFADSNSKSKKALEYAMILAAAGTTATLYTSPMALTGRMALGATTFGVMGIKYGAERDAKAQERQIEQSMKEMSVEIQDLIDIYTHHVPPSEMSIPQLQAFEDRVADLKGELRVMAELRGGGEPSVAETVAEGIAREADRVLFETQSLATLKERLNIHTAKIEDSAVDNLRYATKKTGKWRRVAYGVAGAAFGAAFGWAMGEWAEVRGEHKLEAAMEKMRISDPETQANLISHLAGRPVDSVQDLDLGEVNAIMAKIAPKGNIDLNLLSKEYVASLTAGGDAGTTAENVNADIMLDGDNASLEGQTGGELAKFGYTADQTDLLPPETVRFMQETFTGWEKAGLSAEAIKSFTANGLTTEEVGEINKIIAAAEGNLGAMKVVSETLQHNNGDIKSVVDNMLVGTDKGHNSVTALLAKQLETDPAKFGYQGDLTNAKAVDIWAKGVAAKIAAENGLIGKDGASTGIVYDKNHDSFVMLTQDGQNKLGVKLVGKEVTVGPKVETVELPQEPEFNIDMKGSSWVMEGKNYVVTYDMGNHGLQAVYDKDGDLSAFKVGGIKITTGELDSLKEAIAKIPADHKGSGTFASADSKVMINFYDNDKMGKPFISLKGRSIPLEDAQKLMGEMDYISEENDTFDPKAQVGMWHNVEVNKGMPATGMAEFDPTSKFTVMTRGVGGTHEMVYVKTGDENHYGSNLIYNKDGALIGWQDKNDGEMHFSDNPDSFKGIDASDKSVGKINTGAAVEKKINAEPIADTNENGSGGEEGTNQENNVKQSSEGVKNEAEPIKQKQEADVNVAENQTVKIENNTMLHITPEQNAKLGLLYPKAENIKVSSLVSEHDGVRQVRFVVNYSEDGKFRPGVISKPYSGDMKKGFDDFLDSKGAGSEKLSGSVAERPIPKSLDHFMTNKTRGHIDKGLIELLYLRKELDPQKHYSITELPQQDGGFKVMIVDDEGRQVFAGKGKNQSEVIMDMLHSPVSENNVDAAPVPLTNVDHHLDKGFEIPDSVPDDQIEFVRARYNEHLAAMKNFENLNSDQANLYTPAALQEWRGHMTSVVRLDLEIFKKIVAQGGSHTAERLKMLENGGDELIDSTKGSWDNSIKLGNQDIHLPKKLTFSELSRILNQVREFEVRYTRNTIEDTTDSIGIAKHNIYNEICAKIVANGKTGNKIFEDLLAVNSGDGKLETKIPGAFLDTKLNVGGVEIKISTKMDLGKVGSVIYSADLFSHKSAELEELRIAANSGDVASSEKYNYLKGIFEENLQSFKKAVEAGKGAEFENNNVLNYSWGPSVSIESLKHIK